MLTFIVLIAVISSPSFANFDNDVDINCVGKTYENVTLAAYYPDYEDDNQEDGYKDKNGKKLKTLQDYLDDRNEFITLAMDEKLGISYGTSVCIPELNQHFGHRLRFQVRDNGSNLLNMGYLRADICVRSEMDSYDVAYNRKVSLVFE